MTEAQWLARGDPTPICEFVGSLLSARKLRLLACARAREVVASSCSESTLKAIEAVERFLDGATAPADLQAVNDSAFDVEDELGSAVACVDAAFGAGEAVFYHFMHFGREATKETDPRDHSHFHAV